MKKIADILLTLVYYAFKYFVLLLGLCLWLIAVLFKLVVNRFTMKLPEQGTQTTLDALPKLSIASNWKIPKVETPRLLIHNGGAVLDGIAQHFVDEFAKDKNPNQVVTVAKELTNQPGETRSLRIAQSIQRGHVVATDVVLRREGKDVYVNFGIKTRTLLACLRRVMLATAYLVIVAAAFLIYFKVSGAKETWIKEYAEKNAAQVYPGTNSLTGPFYARRILNGYYTTSWAGFREEYAQDKELVDAETDLFSGKTSSPKARGIIETLKAGDDLGLASKLENASYVDDSIKALIPEQIFRIAFLSKRAEEFSYTKYSVQGDVLINTSFFGTDRRTFPRMIETDWVKEEDLDDDFANFFVFDDKPADERITTRIMEIFWHNTKWNEPEPFSKFLKEDTRGVLLDFSMPIAIVMVLSALLLWWNYQNSWLNFPCRMLGWILPDDYNDRAVSTTVALKRVLVDSLPPNLEVDELKGNLS